MTAATRRPKLLAPTLPNVGVEAEYRRRLTKLIEEMNDSVVYWLEARFKANPPKAALDELPASALRDAIRELTKRWDTKFDDLAKTLARYFATSVSRRSDASLQSAMRRAGLTVRFTMTPAMRDILSATINANVKLIKSIPVQYLTQVEGSVMRSVQTGQDLGALTQDLHQHFGVTRRRAATIARSQNRLATAAFARTRRLEIGITEAVWHHSAGGKEPRPAHVKAGRDRVKFDVREGWYDPAEKKKIQPGELINCRCFSRAVLPNS